MRTKKFFQQCVKILRAKAWIIIVFCTIAVFTSYGLSKMQKRVYDAVAKIIITPRRHTFKLYRNRRFSEKFMQYFHLTQYYLLYSNNIAEQVVDELNLRKYLSPVPNYILPNNEIAVNILKRKFRVEFDPKTTILAIVIEMKDRKLAAKIANKYVEVYRMSRDAVKQKKITETISEIEKQVVRFKKLLVKSEEKVEKIKREQNLFFVKGNNVDKEKIMEINHKYLSVKIDRISKEVLLKKVQESSDSSKANLLSIEKGFLNLADLKLDLVLAKIKFAEFSQVKGKKHPDIIYITKKIDVINKEINMEVDGIVKGIEIQYDVFKKEEEYLLETLASAKKELITLNSKEISYLQAEREMKTNQELYVALKKEYIKYLSLYKLPDMIVDVVEKARVPLPRENVKPQTLINVAFAGVGSLLIGIILVLVYGFIELEVFQNVREMAFSLMGIIPLGLTQTINNVPKNSVKYDSFRGIAARLNLMQKKEKIKTVFVTSCGAGEGKTTVAVNLAIVMADSGKRVLLIDGNRKKSDVANLFDIYESAPGFRDIEEYKDNFKSLITPVVYKNIDIIGGGSAIVNDGTENDGAGFIKDELVKDDIDNLINSLKKYYDFIIIDGPSLIGIHDAIILSNVSDGVLMVVGHKMYPPVTEKEMSKEVKKAKSRLLGVILNHVYQGDEIYKSYYQRSSKKFAYI